MAGVHRLQQVEYFRSAHLADDDPLRAHAQAILDQIAHRDLAFALDVGRAGLKPHDMRLLELQLGRVFASDNALVGVDVASQAVEQRCLARAGTAGDDDIAAHPADDLQDGGAFRRD